VIFLYLTVEQVELLHAEVIAFAGGSYGLRDHGLLESAVSRAENRAYYEPDASLATVAASLSLGLIKNHAFIDGNKRVGLAALIAFLRLNGYRLNCPVEQEIVMVQKAAASDIDEAEWTAWVESVAVPL
jgi:death-on-curing protein